MRAVFSAIFNFLASPLKRRLLFIGMLGLVALLNFLSLGLARRTFVFYTIDGGDIVVEDRMLTHSNSKEQDIIRYTEETLLGPVSPDLRPLFPWETRLRSLLYRDRVVYADFTESASFAPAEGGKLLDNYHTLYESILRNFSYVNDVRFFINGNAVLLDYRTKPEAEKDQPETARPQVNAPSEANSEDSPEI